jgi:hypothetical protein
VSLPGLTALGYAGLGLSLVLAGGLWWLLVRRAKGGGKRWPGWVSLLLMLGLATACFLTTGHCAGDAAPLGSPIPKDPPQFITKIDPKDADVSKRRIPVQWLEFLAPQPDGAAPLRYDYRCELVDFTIRTTMGTETGSFPGESVLKDDVLARALVHYGQGLDQIVYSAPLRPRTERLNEYVSRLRHDLEQQGGKFYPDTDSIDVNGYHFLHYEYELAGEQGPESHYVYFGNYGLRSLTIDFITSPERHEAARSLVTKIIHSFKPGEHLRDSQAQPENLPPTAGAAPAR